MIQMWSLARTRRKLTKSLWVLVLYKKSNMRVWRRWDCDCCRRVVPFLLYCPRCTHPPVETGSWAQWISPEFHWTDEMGLSLTHPLPSWAQWISSEFQGVGQRTYRYKTLKFETNASFLALQVLHSTPFNVYILFYHIIAPMLGYRNTFKRFWNAISLMMCFHPLCVQEKPPPHRPCPPHRIIGNATNGTRRTRKLATVALLIGESWGPWSWLGVNKTVYVPHAHDKTLTNMISNCN